MKTQSESASKSLKSSTLFIWILCRLESWNYDWERVSEREWKFPFDHHTSLVNITRAPLQFKLLHAQRTHTIVRSHSLTCNHRWCFELVEWTHTAYTQHGLNHTKHTIILTGRIAKQRKRSVVVAQALVNNNNDSNQQQLLWNRNCMLLFCSQCTL